MKRSRYPHLLFSLITGLALLLLTGWLSSSPAALASTGPTGTGQTERPLFPAVADSELYTISGRVTDLDGQPLPNITLQSCDLSKQPVLLIPGGDGSDSLLEDVDGLANLYQWMRADGYLEGCNLFWANGINALKSREYNRKAIQQNLRVAYEQLLAYYPNWQGDFDIIGHSFGGLIGRFYLESPYYAADQTFGEYGIHVLNLFTLGTPHGGYLVPEEIYPGAMLLAGKSIFAPGDFEEFLAVTQLYRDSMDFYNFNHRQPPGSRYHLLAGDFLQQENVPQAIQILYAPYAAHPGDIAVSLRSARELGSNPLLQARYPQVCVQTTDDMHGYTNSFGLGDLKSFVRPSTTYAAYIRDVLGSRAGDCPSPVPADIDPAGQAETLGALAKLEIPASSGPSYEATSDENGIYLLPGLAPGSYRVQPSHAQKRFSPQSQTVSVPPAAADVNFIAQTAEPPPVLPLYFPSVFFTGK